MNKDNLKNMTPLQKQNLIQKFNFKRYSKYRTLICVNFIIGLLFVFLLKTTHFNSLNLQFFVSCILIGFYFIFSIPLQIFTYYTKLPTKHFQINFIKNDFGLNCIEIGLILLNISWFCILLYKQDIYVILSTLPLIILLTIWKIYLNTWIRKVLFTNKDKYYQIVKTIYFSLRKSEQNF